MTQDTCPSRTLIVIDEADRLRMASLEQVRAIFDAQEIGLVLIGMPGLEKRLTRFPQFYSRIGFVHEFQPLGATEVCQLLERHWAPVDVALPQKPLDPETIALIIRITGGQLPVTEPSTHPNSADSRNQLPQRSHQNSSHCCPRELGYRAGLMLLNGAN